MGQGGGDDVLVCGQDGDLAGPICCRNAGHGVLAGVEHAEIADEQDGSLMTTGLEVRVEDMLGFKLYKHDVGAFDQSYDIRNIDDEIRL